MSLSRGFLFNMILKSININSEKFPSLLKEISLPPKQLYFFGEFPKSEVPWIAIVGTRKASLEGINLGRRVARFLGERGCVIVSGLALGIDAAAHEGALDVGAKTVAVLGNGPDIIYPRSNTNLYNKILTNGGLILSEYDSQVEAKPYTFLARNRIIAGLSHAIVLIEAPIKSGALHTSRLAMEFGRETYVFPGNALNPQYAGSHALIRDGARLVHNFDDIWEDLSQNSLFKFNFENKTITEKKININIKLESSSELILNLIKENNNGIVIDKIVDLTGLSLNKILEIIGELTLHGMIDEQNGIIKILK